MSVTEKETSNSLYRQWQILSRLPTGKWIGTRELQEMLEREGIEISLRTIQRDLNQIAQRFPIESNKAVPQGWRWQSDAIDAVARRGKPSKIRCAACQSICAGL